MAGTRSNVRTRSSGRKLDVAWQHATSVSRSLMPKTSDMPLRNQQMLSRKSTRLSAQPSALTQDLRSDQVITKKEFDEFKKDFQDFMKYMKKVGDYQKNMGWSLAGIDKESFPQFPNHILETTQEKENATTSKAKAKTSKGKEKKGYSEKKKATAGKKKKKAEKDVEPPMEETWEEHEEEGAEGEKVLEEQAEHQNEGSLAEEEQVEVEDQVEEYSLNIQDAEEEDRSEEENVMKEDNVAEEVTDKQPSKKKKQQIQERESVEVQVEELQHSSEEQVVPHDTSENNSIRKVMNVYERKKWSSWSTMDKAIKDGTNQEIRPKRKQDEKAGVEKPMLEPVKKKIRTNSKFKFTKK
ncbi:putative uncharacterized protein DDB_G0287113 [Medicago truncatula]|uniref:putative uncharacterized protein DDB_G0287113 n=1 Tax=Medicago truncatula TaxID=3880 RepID=UPI00196713AB|nr:putative uncharacterized protein DDB_G0287113 [Medicago truncatula]